MARAKPWREQNVPPSLFSGKPPPSKITPFPAIAKPDFSSGKTITYIDNLLIYDETPVGALKTLEAVLARFRQHNLKINLAKSSILQPITEYLGHTLSQNGISPGKEKASAITNAQPPHTVKQLKSFLGLVNYFRSFIPHFAHKAGKLYALTRKDNSWKGGPLPPFALRTFTQIRDEIAKTVPRNFPRRAGKYHLYVDGSLGDSDEEGGLGAHLMQEDEKGVKHTIAFASRSLKKHEKNYSAFLLELQAAVYATEYFSHYLAGRSLVLYTDHAPLTKLSTQHTKTLHRLHALLNEHHFQMEHIPGKQNAVADFLSRSHGPARTDATEQVAALEQHEAEAQSKLAQAQMQDPALGPIYKALQANQTPASWPHQLARLANRIALKGPILTICLPARQGIPNDEKPRALLPQPLRAEILKNAHNSLIGGHQGVMRTTERIREQFWWPNLDRDVARHVQECVTCQATSNKDAPHHAQHDTFPLARGPNQRLHVDLFGAIKDREGRPKYILGMTDAFTKILRLKAIDSKSAAEVAMAIWTDWMAIYGIPQTIMSDNGKEFVNKLQSSLLKLLQVEQRTTTSYHPVCNQMQEHQNRALAHYLCCALRDAEKSTIEWEYYLPALMLSHNTAVNAATRQSPFTTMFGYNPRLPLWPDLSKVLTQGEFDLPPGRKRCPLWLVGQSEVGKKSGI